MHRHFGGAKPEMPGNSSDFSTITQMAIFIYSSPRARLALSMRDTDKVCVARSGSRVVLRPSGKAASLHYEGLWPCMIV